MALIINREKVNKEFTNYKELLIFANENHNMEVTIHVPFSRFRMLLSKHLQYKGVDTDKELFELNIKNNDFCKLKDFKNNNVFIIVKEGNDAQERYGECNKCRSRANLNKVGTCYYCETVNSEYYTLSMHTLR